LNMTLLLIGLCGPGHQSRSHRCSGQRDSSARGNRQHGASDPETIYGTGSRPEMERLHSKRGGAHARPPTALTCAGRSCGYKDGMSTASTNMSVAVGICEEHHAGRSLQHRAGTAGQSGFANHS
jgi:hypothetical protein